MSLNAKERFIEETGGFRLCESKEQFLNRQEEIQTLRNEMRIKMLSEEKQNRLYKLLGLPPDEFDYEPRD